MTRGFLLFFLSIFILKLNAQNHVTWQGSWNKSSNELVIIGTIEPSWHLYSPKTDPKLGPIPLSVTFPKSKDFKCKGDLLFLTEPAAHQDENFGGMVYIWENKIEIHQAIKVKRESAINLTLNYMICNDNVCIPPNNVYLQINTTK